MAKIKGKFGYKTNSKEVKEYFIERNNLDNKYRVVDCDGTPYGGAYDNPADAVANGYSFLLQFIDEMSEDGYDGFCIIQEP